MPTKFSEKDIQKIIRHYMAGTATPAEKAFIDAWYDHFDKDISPDDELAGLEMKAQIQANIARRPLLHRIRPVYTYAAAACLLILVGIGIYKMRTSSPGQKPAMALMNDIQPGGNQAILTLGNGQQIVLGNQTGAIATQGNASVELDKDGQVNYRKLNSRSVTLYNTLTVPTGNRRNIILADGTSVDLDAGSSLTFPVSFGDGERSVQLKGQGYFKVKHNAAHPFVVKAKGLLIRDLGTEFNINAYEDEPAIATTLFEGSLKVNEKLLQPGEQALAINQSIQIKQADLEMIAAWKNNDFIFRNQDLQTTMRQIARWYNVEVVYENAPAALRIRAAISRNRNLSVVLQLMEATGKVKFRIDGRKVIVSQ